MEAELHVPPELDLHRRQPVAAPIGRPRNGAEAEFQRQDGGLLQQLGARLERPRLLARPGADAAFARAGGEIGVGIAAGNLRHRAAQAHLPAQRLPVEQRRRLRVGGELDALGALAVGVKHQPGFVELLAQHGAQVGQAGGVDGGERDRLGVVDLGLGRLGEPQAEKRERIVSFGKVTRT
jgi:hypothetical protein